MKKLLSLIGATTITTSGGAPLMAMTPGFINTIEENNIIKYYQSNGVFESNILEVDSEKQVFLMNFDLTNILGITTREELINNFDLINFKRNYLENGILMSFNIKSYHDFLLSNEYVLENINVNNFSNSNSISEERNLHLENAWGSANIRLYLEVNLNEEQINTTEGNSNNNHLNLQILIRAELENFEIRRTYGGLINRLKIIVDSSNKIWFYKK
ncbi:hypothetical protein C6B38_03020 [Spiroplasma sp. ChiS]|uniref:hypothetical protein n=1 Tax=Spiroplasma sp. ChiS TaxID=2099885 RepID=UPI000CFA15FB|nr:hypothetical protein [Spiroplasma sp. ChiS]PQP78948.1 hypothetical protein C6B38_03020 [Spiroplasma sp. ChiS]